MNHRLAQLLLIALGGGVGSVLRYLVGGWVQDWLRESTLPWGTAVINVTGCLLIGLLAGLDEARALFSPDTRLLLFIGLLGGFTTFSTFGYETMQLLRNNQPGAALLMAGGQVVLGLLAVWLGLTLSRML